jgi:hypothetical protein
MTLCIHFHTIWLSKTNLEQHQIFIKRDQNNQIFSAFRTTCRRIQSGTESLGTLASEKDQVWQSEAQIFYVQYTQFLDS